MGTEYFKPNYFELPSNTEVVFNCRIKYSLKTNSALYQIDFQLRHLTSKLVQDRCKTHFSSLLQKFNTLINKG